MSEVYDAALRRHTPVTAWEFDRDAAVVATATEMAGFRMPDFNAHAFGLAAFCEEIAQQKADAGECDIVWATFHKLAARLRAP
jgi:hypothetical protein